MNDLRGHAVVYLVGFASVFVILFGIRASAIILNPILLAAVITITVLPIPGQLKARGMPGWLSLITTILVVTLVLAMVILVVFFSVTALGNDLPSYLGEGSQQTEADTTSSGAESTSSATTPVSTMETDSSAQSTAESGGTSAQPAPEASDASSETTIDNEQSSVQTSSVSPGIGAFAQGAIESVINLLVQFGWALVIFFFMLSAAISMPAPSRLGMDPDLPAINRISSLTEDVRKYMSILTVVNFLVGLGDMIFLFIIGVEYAALWGLLAWFMGYIPSIGFMIALIPPVLMAYAQFGIQTALVVLIGYIVINGGVQNFIQPKIMGQGLRISPVVVFIGLFVWGYLLGGIGAILAVPLTMLVLIAMENFPGTRNLAILMRYTGEEKKEERQKAAKSLRGAIDRINIFSRADKDAQEKGGGKSEGADEVDGDVSEENTDERTLGK